MTFGTGSKDFPPSHFFLPSLQSAFISVHLNLPAEPLQKILKRLRDKYPRFTQGFYLSANRTTSPFDNHPGMTEPHTFEVVNEPARQKGGYSESRRFLLSATLRVVLPQPRPARRR